MKSVIARVRHSRSPACLPAPLERAAATCRAGTIESSTVSTLLFGSAARATTSGERPPSAAKRSASSALRIRPAGLVPGRSAFHFHSFTQDATDVAGGHNEWTLFSFYFAAGAATCWRWRRCGSAGGAANWSVSGGSAQASLPHELVARRILAHGGERHSAGARELVVGEALAPLVR